MVSGKEAKRKWREQNPEKVKEIACKSNKIRNDRGLNKWVPHHEIENETCEIIKKHHEDMEGDPESLTTEFIQQIIGRKCEEDTPQR